MGLDVVGKARTRRRENRREVGHFARFVQLSPETFGDESRAKAFANGVDGGGGARRTPSDDKDVVGKCGRKLFGFAADGVFIKERHDFLERLSSA